MNRTTRLVLAVGIGAALILAACGDDRDAADALPKPEFVEQANAICAATDAELEPVWEAVWAMDEADFDDPDQMNEESQNLVFTRFAGAMDTVVPAWHRAVDEIRALGIPVEDRDLVNTLLDDLEVAIDDVHDTTRAAADGDVGARERMDEEAEDPLADVNRRARDYGLSVCGTTD